MGTTTMLLRFRYPGTTVKLQESLTDGRVDVLGRVENQNQSRSLPLTFSLDYTLAALSGGSGDRCRHAVEKCVQEEWGTAP